MNIRIGPIKEPERYWELLDVMKDAWNMPDYTEAVPPHFLRAIADNGGVVLAAFDGDEIIGFVLGIVAKKDGNIYHYSHMLGVKKKYWGKGVGLRLKLAQREAVLRQGLDLVKWTYDPHQGLNAKFNFAKLGVVCNTFYENYYGVMKDGINRGLLSDRFKVKWWIRSKRVIDRIEGKSKPPSFDDVKDIADFVVKTEKKDDIRLVSAVNLDSNNELLLVEIPADINKLKEKSLSLANDWKIKLRPVFKGYFNRGYYVAEFITIKEEGERRNFYLLWHAPLEDILSGVVPWK